MPEFDEKPSIMKVM